MTSFRRLSAFLLSALLAPSLAGASIARLEPCEPPGFQGPAKCGSLTVPEDRSARDGRTIDLRIVVLEPTGEEPSEDPLVFFSGGPGTAATESAPLFAGLPFREDRALVFVDQRGTGGSHPLDCRLENFGEGVEALLSFDLGPLADRCAKELSERADLRFYGTRQIVEDLEDVRRALGVERWNLMGGSYGTRVALEYVRRHPEHVRTAILRGVAGPEVDIPLGFAGASLAATRSLAAACAADEACAREMPDLEATVRELMAELDANPVTVAIPDPATGEAHDLVVRGQELAAMLHYPLYSTQLATRLPAIVASARKGDLQPAVGTLTALAGQLLPRFHFGSFLSVLCTEDVPFMDDASIEAASEGTLLGGTFPRGLRASCASWPRGSVAPDFKAPVESDVPVLLVSGAADPVTPPADAESARQRLRRSRHVTMPAVSHFALLPGCVGDLVADFLESASVEDLDSTCVASFERPAFG